MLPRWKERDSMARTWSFGQKVGAGFALTVALAITIVAVSVYALRNVVSSKDRVIAVDAHLLIDAEQLNSEDEAKASAARGFLLTGESRYLDKLKESRDSFAQTIERLRRNVYDDEGRRLVDGIDGAQTDYRQAIDRVIALRRTDAAVSTISREFDNDATPKLEVLDGKINAFISLEERLLEQARQASSDDASSAIALVVLIGVAVVVLAALVSFLLSRTLGRQVGDAIGQVQSSSVELQAAATQQATGAKEQATAMTEITTTISELLATSRQIAESAQRVAHVAGQTASAALSGEGTVEKAHESITGISRQVDLIVSHMLELGKKSQQIGAVLDIVSELAEQTNILAINATIEAAGAGENGKRFAVVAEEIRKLADRVAASTKDVRTLIDDVRSAVNTTIFATESGSKAVDAGSRQFSEVASALKQIAGLVSTTTEAAREIELSTKQQSTAVEQVNVAISSVAQATKETEVSSGQTLQTASQLAGLSRALLRLIEPQAA
jgi:methyl-accepting chemotaxis protein